VAELVDAMSRNEMCVRPSGTVNIAGTRAGSNPALTTKQMENLDKGIEYGLI